MTLLQYKAQLQKGVEDYDAGRITLSALLTLTDITTEDAYKAGYKDGLHDAEIDGSSSEVEFDADFDLDDLNSEEGDW